MTSRRPWWPAHWRWPLPAVLAWLAAWLVFKLMAGQGLSPSVALGSASALGVACSLWGKTWWRRLLMGAGFPLSLATSLAPASVLSMPAWAWLLPLGLLLLVYPINAWRDAPLFPTPKDALLDLPRLTARNDGAGFSPPSRGGAEAILRCELPGSLAPPPIGAATPLPSCPQSRIPARRRRS